MTASPPAPSLQRPGDSVPPTPSGAPSLNEGCDDSFDWTRQWYPVAVPDALEPDRPHAITLLGLELVIWRDGSGAWRCFQDACPHRQVPLSEGRVEADGTLLCAYHAWRFNGEGQCVRIPQAMDAATEASHCANPRSRPTAYPTLERQGLLWVWPESGDGGLRHCREREPDRIEELDDSSGRVVAGPWNVRDLPYGWEFFMENVADPAHVPVSHHGLVGNRYTGAQYVRMPTVRSPSTREGFAFAVEPVPDAIERAVHDFRPPALMRIASEFKDGSALLLVLYASPTRPGWCRHIGRQVLVRNPSGALPRGLAFFSAPLPVWALHVLASRFLHQDLVFLHRQERTLAHGAAPWADRFFTPNPQDRMVITLRQWLARHAPGGIPWADSAAVARAAEGPTDPFDVWHTHTAHCRQCRAAHTNILRGRNGATLLSIALLALAVGVDARASAAAIVSGSEGWPAPEAASLLLLALAGLGLSSAVLLHRLGRQFHRYPFSHADND